MKIVEQSLQFYFSIVLDGLLLEKKFNIHCQLRELTKYLKANKRTQVSINFFPAIYESQLEQA